MGRVFRYGVFEVGRIWCVVCDGQAELEFPRREQALAAVDVLRKTHRLAGDDCEVFMLDDVSRLVPLPTESGVRA
jgi:hypothetical protein